MKRLNWADSLKGVLMVLVVLGHAIQETLKAGCFDNHVWNYVYSFHMPAFMALSGFLNFQPTVCVEGGGGITNRLSIIYRRFQQLLIPFLLWALIKELINPPYHLKGFVNAILYPDGSFWFLWVLFFISVFFYFGDWLAEKMRIKQELVIIVLCIVLVLLMLFADIRVFGFQFVAYYFLFYSLGYYFHKYDKAIVDSMWLLVLLSVIWAVMAWFWNMHKLPSFLSSIPLPHTLMQYGYRFVTAVIAVYVLFVFAPKWLNTDYKWNRPLLQLGKISLGIYTVHLLLMPFIVKLLSSLIMHTYLIIIISCILSLSASWLLVNLLSKWRVTARLLLGKI